MYISVWSSLGIIQSLTYYELESIYSYMIFKKTFRFVDNLRQYGFVS